MLITITERAAPKMCARIGRNLFQVFKTLNNNKLSYLQAQCAVKQVRIAQVKLFSSDQSEDVLKRGNESEAIAEDNLSIISSRYKTFKDDDATEILDVDEEIQRIDLEELKEAVDEDANEFAGLNLERGKTGVFDIEELIEVLKKNKGRQIFVVSVPPNFGYVDYLVIVSGRSGKHMQAMASFVYKLYKSKKCVRDIIPKVEGKKSSDWIAVDLGNIALHVFDEDIRRRYDLESLWTYGPEFDKTMQQPDTTFDIAAKYEEFLAQLEPAESSEEPAQKDLA